MANTFTKEDARTCFGCDQNPPSFRLISLERLSNGPDNWNLTAWRAYSARLVSGSRSRILRRIYPNNLPLRSDESTESCLADRLDSQLFLWRSARKNPSFWSRKSKPIGSKHGELDGGMHCTVCVAELCQLDARSRVSEVERVQRCVRSALIWSA